MSERNAQDFLDSIGFKDVISENIEQYPNLVGFYESKKMGENIPESIDLFMHEFSGYLSGTYLYSTATNFPSRHWGENDRSLASHLESMGWFKFERPEAEITTEFSKEKITESKIDSLKVLFQLILKGMTDGYVFLYCKKEHLVIYPHKYEGFGFMADKNTSGYRIAKQFLERIERDYSKLFLVSYI